MKHVENTETVQDGVVAGSLIASPAWVPWLDHLNTALTTLTLALGIALAAARIWQICRHERHGHSQPTGKR